MNKLQKITPFVFLSLLYPTFQSYSLNFWSNTKYNASNLCHKQNSYGYDDLDQTHRLIQSTHILLFFYCDCYEVLLIKILEKSGPNLCHIHVNLLHKIIFNFCKYRRKMSDNKQTSRTLFFYTCQCTNVCLQLRDLFGLEGRLKRRASL